MLAALRSTRLHSRWPVAAYPRSYVIHGGAPLAVFLRCWTVFANFSSNGDPYPLAYLPLLNPLDIALGFAVRDRRRVAQSAREHGLDAWWELARLAVLVVFAIIGFVCV